MPATGHIDGTEGILVPSFGTIFDSAGIVDAPGATNVALAEHIVGHEVIRDLRLPLYLQQEVAVAAIQLDSSIATQVAKVILTNKAPGRAFNTREVIQHAMPDIISHGIGKLAILPFRYHAPRALYTGINVAQPEGIEIVYPGMQAVGDFDPRSSQPRTRSKAAWVRGERLIIPLNYAFGYLGEK
jgi:hypothetical protein